MAEISFLLKLAGIMLFGAAFFLSALQDRREIKRQWHDFCVQQVQTDELLGHPEWTPLDWKKEAETMRCQTTRRQSERR